MHSQFEQRQTRSSHDYDRIDDSYDTGSVTGGGTTYRSVMSPRVINIQRARASALGGGGGGGGGVMTRMYQSIQSSGGGGGGAHFGQGLASLANFPGVPMRGQSSANTAVVGLNVNRQRDKRDLEQLNDKFAQYLEKVRFLEAQNRKLLMELESLKGRSGQGSSRIKEMYDIEMAEAGRLIDGTKQDAATANIKTQQAEQEVKRQRARYNEMTTLRDTENTEIDAIRRKVAENEAQIALFRRRMADLEDEGHRYKAQAQRLSSEIGRLQNEIQNEKFLKSSCEVEKLALDDELASVKQMHESDLAELRSHSVSNDLDPSQFFRNELSQAIKEIRNDYENRVDGERSDMQNRYSLVCNELVVRQNRPDASPQQNEQQRRHEERYRSDLLQTQNQNAYLKAQTLDLKNRIEDLQRKMNLLREDGSAAQAKMAKEIEDAKRRLEVATQDYAEVTTMKTSLEKEITTYRDLLESQTGLRGYVDRIVKSVEQQAIDRPSGGGGSFGGGGGGGGGSSSFSSYGGSYSGGGGGGGGGRAGGSSASISHTFINTTGSNYGFGSSTGGGTGLSNLVAQTTRPSTGYQTISSGVRTTFRDSTGSESQTRTSGDY